MAADIDLNQQTFPRANPGLVTGEDRRIPGPVLRETHSQFENRPSQFARRHHLFSEMAGRPDSLGRYCSLESNTYPELQSV
jgi:hypothetical protein